MNERRTVEEAIQVIGEADMEVNVRTESGFIKITWPCGGRRDYTPDDLDRDMGYLELLSGFNKDLWVSYGDGDFYARLKDDVLTIGEVPDADDAHSIKWSVLKLVVEDSIRE